MCCHSVFVFISSFLKAEHVGCNTAWFVAIINVCVCVCVCVCVHSCVYVSSINFGLYTCGSIHVEINAVMDN